MRSPLLAPALACLLLGGVLVAALLELCSPEPWSPAEAMELAEPVLPVATQGEPSHRADVVVILQHKPPKETSCARDECEDVEHWQVKLRLGGAASEEVNPYPFSLASGAFLRDQLRKATAGCPDTSDPSGRRPKTSEATLTIRTAATTPYGIVQQLVVDVALSGIYRIGLAVTTAGAEASERLLEVPLPFEERGWGRVEPKPALCVSLKMDRKTRGCVRREVEPPSEPDFVPEGEIGEPSKPRREGKEFPCDVAGDAQLQSFVRAWLADPVRQGSKEVSGIIDAAPDVPFQAIIDLIGAFRAAGMEQIEFLAPEPK